MLDTSAREFSLMKEVTALQRIRTLQDPGTSSSVTTSGGSSGTITGTSVKKAKTFLGDPQKDAQALAIELSGKLANPVVSDTRAANRRQRKESKKSVRVDDKAPRRRTTAKKETVIMTGEEFGSGDEGSSNGRRLSNKESEPVSMGVRERIQRIESALERSGASVTASGELRKAELIRELGARQLQSDGSDDRWDGGGVARREELARKIVAEQEPRGSSVSSLSQLLGRHYGSGRSALDLLGMVADEEHRHHFGLVQSDEDEEFMSPMEVEISRSPPLVTSRGRHELSKPRAGHARKRPGSGARAARHSAKSSSHPAPSPPPPTVLDDELAALPAENGWDWSRIHKYGGKAFLDLTGLTCTLREGSTRQYPGLEQSIHPVQSIDPVQSISSLDSDANALPLVIGEDAHDSDYIEAGISHGSREVEPQGKRKASLQSAVKDVPPGSKRGGGGDHGDGHRTLTQKYRPKSFGEIVGQGVVVKSLATAVVKGKVAPVYLFMGPRGTGKTTAARVFAAGLNCHSPNAARRPCGICRECGTMALNRSADVRQIDAAAGFDLASMRAMMGSFTPHARYKVFIVEACDMLVPEIWNAFLKVLEEPPRNVVFVLITTDADRIPVTAISRCQKFLFSKVKEFDIVTRLTLLASKEGLTVEPGALSLIASRSDGSLRDAEIVLDQLCLLDKHVSVALVQELVGILPDSKVLDLLDYALSANTVNTVRALRDVLDSGVEPLALVAQLAGVITDILVGTLEIDREARAEGFFSRNLSTKEEQHRLRLALKILADAEKQLRVAADRPTWLTAALLQFAPDRSFVPSSANTSAAPSPTVPESPPGPSVNYPIYNQEDASEPEEAQLAPEGEETFDDAYTERKTHPTPEQDLEEEVSVAEQKLEEAWAGDQPEQVVVEDDGEISEGQRVVGHHGVEFQELPEDALFELWRRVVSKAQPRNLKNLLQTHGRLVAAGLAFDGSCAVVELEFDYARDKHKAERSWRSICIAFQAILTTAVELRIALSDMVPDEARIGETMVDIIPSPSEAHPNGKVVANEEAAQTGHDAPPSHPARHRRRGRKARRHREAAAEFVSSSDPGGMSPRLPPHRRRRAKRTVAAQAAVTPIVEMEIETAASAAAAAAAAPVSSTEIVPREIRAVTETKPRERKPLSTHMEDPMSEIEDLQSAKRRIMKQRSLGQFRNESSLALIQRPPLMADLQRGLPKESGLCWRRPSPQSDFLKRKSRVKSVKRAQGMGGLGRLVPCRDTRVTQNEATPASEAPASAMRAAGAA